MDPIVVAVVIQQAKGLWDFSLMEYGGSAVAHLTMSDESIEHFGWFHDEISYYPTDFTGKTLAEIREMHRERDMRYLQS